MDENLQSFSLRGRIYYLDTQMMDIIQYYKSYNTTPQIACDALGYRLDMYDWSTPEVRLYENYIDTMTSSTSMEEEKKYIKAKLWTLVDSTGLRANDLIKACEMLLSLTITNSDDISLKNLTYDQILQLLDKLK